jgi:hypothetical protein
LLFQGYKTPLEQHDLYALPNFLESQVLADRTIIDWNLKRYPHFPPSFCFLTILHSSKTTLARTSQLLPLSLLVRPRHQVLRPHLRVRESVFTPFPNRGSQKWDDGLKWPNFGQRVAGGGPPVLFHSA